MKERTSQTLSPCQIRSLGLVSTTTNPPVCISLTPSQGETIDPSSGLNRDLPTAKSWLYRLYHTGCICLSIVIVCYDLKCLLCILEYTWVCLHFKLMTNQEAFTAYYCYAFIDHTSSVTSPDSSPCFMSSPCESLEVHWRASALPRCTVRAISCCLFEGTMSCIKDLYPEKDLGTTRQDLLSCYPLRGCLLGGLILFECLNEA